MKANRASKFSEFEKIYRPIIVKYQLDTDNLQNNCKGKIFGEPNEAWAEFIYNNRIKSENECSSSSHNRNKTYDYVYGHLADGKIATIINEHRKCKNVDIEQFLKEIFPKFPNNNDQISLHSNDAVRCLKFIEIIHDTNYQKR